MRKELFLEYKFGDYDLDLLKKSGANGLIVWMDHLTPTRWKTLSNLKMRKGVCVAGIQSGKCPLNPEEEKGRLGRIKKALSYDPDVIWVDHIRFSGYWEGAGDKKSYNVHPECKYCKDKNRVETIVSIAKNIHTIVNGRTQLAYFAVPFGINDMPNLTPMIGQDHKLLAKYFDLISPMVYHRMIDKPVSYISELVTWLSEETQKPIIPIIQAKDMPDDLPDKIDEDEMQKMYREAVKTPSAGVAWFSWDGAIEKGKTQIIRGLF